MVVEWMQKMVMTAVAMVTMGNDNGAYAKNGDEDDVGDYDAGGGDGSNSEGGDGGGVGLPSLQLRKLRPLGYRLITSLAETRNLSPQGQHKAPC